MSDTKVPLHAETTGGRARPGTPRLNRQNLDAEGPTLDILHLAELVPVVRERFGIDGNFPDDAILASLKTIAAASSDRERSEMAFASNLGRYLDCSHQSEQSSLAALIALLPQPRS